MIVKRINWIDENIKEASIELFDDLCICKVFCHPCNLNIGDKVDYLFAMFVTNIFKENNKNHSIIKNNATHFSYNIIASVFDKEKKIVKINNINVELDSPIPNDIFNNDIISFQCLRLDV